MANNKTSLKVLFLDIDGVLLPFPKDDKDSATTDSSSDGDELFPSSTLTALKHLMEELDDGAGVKIVLSSTWRVREDFIQDVLDAIRSFDGGGGSGGIFGFENGFYDITDPTVHSERQWEIEAWLTKNRRRQNDDEQIVWLALDDEELLEGDANEKFRKFFEGHVIKTHSHRGLTMDDVNDALRLWKVQLSLV